MSDRKESKAAARKTATISDWNIQGVTLDNRIPGIVITISLETEEAEPFITKPFAFPISINNLLFKAPVVQELKQFSLERIANGQIVFDTDFLDYCLSNIKAALFKEFVIEQSTLREAVFEREGGSSLEDLGDPRKIRQKAQYYLGIQKFAEGSRQTEAWIKKTEELEAELKAVLAKHEKEMAAKKEVKAKGGQIAPEITTDDEIPSKEVLNKKLKLAIEWTKLAKHFFNQGRPLDPSDNPQATQYHQKATDWFKDILSTGQLKPASSEAESKVRTIRVQPQFPYPDIKLASLIEHAKLEEVVGNQVKAKELYESALAYLTKYKSKFVEPQYENLPEQLTTKISGLESSIKKQQQSRHM